MPWPTSRTTPRIAALGLPYLKASPRLDAAALEHVVALYHRVRELEEGAPRREGAALTRPAGARAANAALRDEMRRRDNYFEEIERVAAEALAAAGYDGPGAVSERQLADISSHFGFSIARVQGLPTSTRSITDTEHRTIYVPQRNETGGTSSSRSVIAQTLGHFALGHETPSDFESYVRQRVEANYFAGALLAPESAAVRLLTEAKRNEDIAVEDLSEMFYVSYEMAAHRLTNLITRHFGIPVHFQRSDPEGILWKAYENDGVLLPAAVDGTIEGQRLCRWWSSRQAFDSEDSYEHHYQRTDTAAGTFWCHTHISLDRDRGDAITVGTRSTRCRTGSEARTRRAVPLDLSRPGLLPPTPRAKLGLAGRARPGPRRGIRAASSRAYRRTRWSSTPIRALT